jgi:hypothetical protein
MAPEFISHGRRLPEFQELYSKDDLAKGKGKLDDDNKDQEDQRDKGF